MEEFSVTFLLLTLRWKTGGSRQRFIDVSLAGDYERPHLRPEVVRCHTAKFFGQ
jgi:hypothetical protein